MKKYVILLSVAISVLIIQHLTPSFSLSIPKTYIVLCTLGLLLFFIVFIDKVKNIKSLNKKKLADKIEELRDEKERLKLTIENIKEGIIITDKYGNIVDANKKTLQVLGTSRDKITGIKVQDIIHLKDKDDAFVDFSGFFNATIKDKKSFSLDNLNLQIPNSTDSISIEDSLSPILNENEAIGTVMVFRDITESLKLREEKIVMTQKIDQLERMSIMGDFLTGIAHNFGNIIGVINGQIEMVKLKMNDSDNFNKYFLKIDDKMEESKILIKKLSVFNARADFEKIPVNINNLIKTNRASLLKIIPSSTNINVDLKSKKTLKIDIIDFDRLFLTILSYLKKNIPDNNYYINIKTYDEQDYVILEFFTSYFKENTDFYLFNIEDILKRNDVIMAITNKNETIIKLSFKI